MQARPISPAPIRAPSRWPAVVESAIQRLIPPEERINLALLYARILLTRELTESPFQWRASFVEMSPRLDAYDVSYWPLSKAAHQRRRLALMRRWFPLSAYARSFMMDAERLGPAGEIASRHEQFLQSVLPTTRVVFFPAPELTEALPEHVRQVLAEAKRILLQTLAKYPNVVHVDVDYQACGLVAADFWSGGAMYFDIPHANYKAVPKVTKCVVNALAQAGIARAVDAP